MKTIPELLNSKSTTIIDVRSPQAFASGAIPGAINIPVDQINERIEEIREMKSPFLVYCRSGARSGMAASIMLQAGIKEVFNGGGISQLQFHLQFS